MSRDGGLSDIRFEGFDNGGLAEQVDGLRNGPGSGSLQETIEGLTRLALGLVSTDLVLRQQLADIGVTWQGEAADGGTTATENARIYAEEAVAPVTDSAGAVRDTTSAFHTTSNGAPESDTLRGPTEESGFDKVAGFFGHTTDHAQQVKDTNAARNAAIDAMNGYRDSSADALNQAKPLPVPPGMNLVTQPADASTGISSVGSYNPGSGFTPGGGPGGGSGTSPLPGTGGPGGPGGQPPTVGPNPPVTPNPPITGPLPNNPSITPGPIPAALRAANPMLMAEAATAMTAGGASGAGAGAERDRLARSGSGARGPLKNGVPIGTVPDEEARAARNAEKFGAKTGRPGGSIMQPAAAAGGRTAEGEEDKEHVRRYGVESSDVFDDNRVVAPESIGDDDDDDR